MTAEGANLDIFHHDSKHTHAQIMLEYQTVWPVLRDRGLLLSGDVLWNSAFANFCSEKGIKATVVNGIGFTIKN